MASLDPEELRAVLDARRARPEVADGAPFEVDGPVLAIDFPHGGMIAAPRDTGLRGADLDALIRRQRDRFAARGRQLEWKTYAHDEPADLTDRLAAAGFVPEERETVLVGSSEALAGMPETVPGVEIRATEDPADFTAIGVMESAVWGEDWSWIADDLTERAASLGRAGFRVVVAEAEGRVVSAAWLVMRPGGEFASLWGGSTLADHRGRGIYRALVARRAAVAREAGYPYLQVDASEMSRPILERLGFVAVATTTPYVHPAP